MLNDDDFVDNYISECIDNGIKDKDSICSYALKEMDEIDIKIREINALRIRYKNLKDVLRSFNHDSVKRLKQNNVLPEFSDFSDIGESEYLPMIMDICNLIEVSSTGITSREILDRVGSVETNSECYLCIKALSDNGIISRNESRLIFRGPKWDERPKINTNINSA